MRVLLNPAGDQGTEAKLEFRDIPRNEDLKSLVGGWMEIVRVTPPLVLEGTRIVMVVDEEGVGKQKPINWAASAIYGTQIHGHYIYGDVFFVGEAQGPEGGDFVDFPDMPVEAVRGAFSRHIMSIGSQ